ncbi:MAG: carbohydrate binding domain-containing protein [Candidatus Omnitrophota bacterium]
MRVFGSTFCVVAFAFAWLFPAPAMTAEASLPVNLVVNGSFETKSEGNNGLAEGWSGFSDVEVHLVKDGKDGTFAQKIACKEQSGIFQRITVKKNTTYVISAYVKTDGTQADVRVYQWDINDPWSVSDEKIIGSTTSQDWVLLKTEYTTAAEQEGIFLKLMHQPSRPGEAFFDKVEITKK